jgi:hypothetical protein
MQGADEPMAALATRHALMQAEAERLAQYLASILTGGGALALSLRQQGAASPSPLYERGAEGGFCEREGKSDRLYSSLTVPNAVGTVLWYDGGRPVLDLCL